MSNLELTNVYLEKGQKGALAQKAKANGTNLSVEIRRAVDVYLTGVTKEELELLDAATRQIKVEFDQIIEILDRSNARAEKFFAEIEKIRAEAELYSEL